MRRCKYANKKAEKKRSIKRKKKTLDNRYRTAGVIDFMHKIVNFIAVT